ncbi:unnamed protein product [Acanthosepion pharaonis]|uniref:Uncharacterized protein n=1 Tax=Acanthosepion pharaonis TaxID=158019 RepID=A0A812DLL1_ACAPH|nr:unnamed protein product [Sepia pharaonis]
MKETTSSTPDRRVRRMDEPVVEHASWSASRTSKGKGRAGPWRSAGPASDRPCLDDGHSSEVRPFASLMERSDAHGGPQVPAVGPFGGKALQLSIIGRDVDHQRDELIAAPAILLVKALALQAQRLARAAPLGDRQHDRALDSRTLTGPPSTASFRVTGRSRRTSSPSRVKKACGADLDRDDRIAGAARSGAHPCRPAASACPFRPRQAVSGRWSCHRPA